MVGGGSSAGRRPPRTDAIFTAPFVLLMVGNAASAMCSSMTLTLVPLFVLHQGLSSAVAGLTTSLYMLTAVVFRPIGGRLVDTRGRFAVLVVGSVLYCLATGLYVVTLPIWAFLAARAAQGIGFSLTGTAVMTLATDMIPERRMSEGIGYLGLETTLAQVTGPLVALTLAQSAGFHVAFLVVFAFGLANIVLRFPLQRRLKSLDRALVTAHRARAATSIPLWHRLIEPSAWRPATVMFFVMFGNGAVNTFLAAYAIRQGIPEVGLFFSCSGASVAAARLTVGRLERRFGSGRLTAVGIGSITVALLLVFWSPNLPVLLVAGVLFGSGMGIAQPMINTLVVLSAPRERRGMANSTFFLAMDLSQVVSGISLGLIADAAGLASPFIIAAAVTAATCVASILLARGPSRSHRPVPGTAS